ncbi:hypothetical protein ENBRE01_1834 [Enteropsectra breve]|nr:hypothetical protein ENBRE01_1834 [Enteropsectra breve]
MFLMRRVEFYRRISNNENSLEYAAELGLLSFVRPHCYTTGCNGLMNLETGKSRHSIDARWRCNKRACRKTKSFFANTIFHDSKMSISSMLEAIYFYCELGSIEHKASQQGVTKKTLGLLYEKIGRIIITGFSRNQDHPKIRPVFLFLGGLIFE